MEPLTSDRSAANVGAVVIVVVLSLGLRMLFEYGGVWSFAIGAAVVHATLLILYVSASAGGPARLLWIVQGALAIISGLTILQVVRLPAWQFVVLGTLLFASVGVCMGLLRRLPGEHPDG